LTDAARAASGASPLAIPHSTSGAR